MAVFLAAVAFLSYIFFCLSLDRISFSVYFAVFHEFSIDFTVWSFVFTLCRPTVISICISLLLHKERVRQRSNNDNFADRQHGLCEPKLIWLELCVCVFFSVALFFSFVRSSTSAIRYIHFGDVRLILYFVFFSPLFVHIHTCLPFLHCVDPYWCCLILWPIRVFYESVSDDYSCILTIFRLSVYTNFDLSTDRTAKRNKRIENITRMSALCFNYIPNRFDVFLFYCWLYNKSNKSNEMRRARDTNSNHNKSSQYSKNQIERERERRVKQRK